MPVEKLTEYCYKEIGFFYETKFMDVFFMLFQTFVRRLGKRENFENNE